MADGTGSLATHLILGVATLGLPGILVPFAARLLAGGRSAQSLLSGLGNGMLVGIGGMQPSGMAGQLDVPQALGTRMGVPVLLGALVVAVLRGTGSALLVRAAFPARAVPGATTARQAASRQLTHAPGARSHRACAARHGLWPFWRPSRWGWPWWRSLNGGTARRRPGHCSRVSCPCWLPESFS